MPDIRLFCGREQGKAGQRGERRAGLRRRQTGQSARPADADVAVEGALREVGDGAELGAAAGEHKLPRLRAGEPQLVELDGDLPEDQVEPVADDADDLRLGHAHRFGG